MGRAIRLPRVQLVEGTSSVIVCLLFPSARGEGVSSGVLAVPPSMCPVHRNLTPAQGCVRVTRETGLPTMPEPTRLLSQVTHLHILCNSILQPPLGFLSVSHPCSHSLPRMVTRGHLQLGSKPGSSIFQLCDLAVFLSPAWGHNFLICRSQLLCCD